VIRKDLSGSRCVCFILLLSDGVQRDLLALSQWRLHLCQKPTHVTSDFRVSFLFECIVHGIPAMLDLAASCEKLRFARLGLASIAVDIRVKLRLDVGR
jgi:hypothetical protein